jgi:hypothetical protein
MGALRVCLAHAPTSGMHMVTGTHRFFGTPITKAVITNYAVSAFASLAFGIQNEISEFVFSGLFERALVKPVNATL